MGLIPLWPLTHDLTSDRVVANTDAEAGNLQDSHPEFVPDPLKKRCEEPWKNILTRPDLF